MHATSTINLQKVNVSSLTHRSAASEATNILPRIARMGLFVRLSMRSDACVSAYYRLNADYEGTVCTGLDFLPSLDHP